MTETFLAVEGKRGLDILLWLVLWFAGIFLGYVVYLWANRLDLFSELGEENGRKQNKENKDTISNNRKCNKRKG